MIDEVRVIHDPCWECIKGRHLNCQRVAHHAEEPCDCPHPADPGSDAGLVYDPTQDWYTIDD